MKHSSRLKNSKNIFIFLSALILFFVCGPSERQNSSESGLGKYKPPKLPDAPAEYQKKKNELEGKKESIANGKDTYRRKCEKCHGQKGDGNGKKAAVLAYRPAEFSKPGYLKTRSDGQLFFIIEKGSPGTDMDAQGPGTSVNLSETEIWEIISYLRAEFTK
ncbi:MAG: c-type cytochrome [Spirochaetia bacterium]|nr:c-type cytochrome [Spirochaetia bacterium]